MKHAIEKLLKTVLAARPDGWIGIIALASLGLAGYAIHQVASAVMPSPSRACSAPAQTCCGGTLFRGHSGEGIRVLNKPRRRCPPMSGFHLTTGPAAILARLSFID
jgi:hypothetical protein